ncbi:MAG: Rpn family recombination-promoting nuclease/putative transposase, partial [Schwartzia sp.]|nr:Rpn family recombination-promoting nuclease/putative transposase [Schwartzia sp. (in: firmicutes)]
MGEKDLTQKQLAEYEDIFADIINVLLLDGKWLIKPDELKPAKRDSLYKDKSMKLRMQERDIAKFWEKGGIRLAFIGLEDQTKIHSAMPLRVIGYDGAVYRDELNALKPEDETEKLVFRLYPVITLVLHFDYERHWTAPRTLKECFPTIPTGLDPYINDYKIHVFEIAWLPDETIAKFNSDFRFVADYYSQMRKTGKWQPMPGNVKHVKELFELFNALTSDKRFIEMYAKRKEEQNDMASIALDYWEDVYTEKGR